MGSLYGSTSFGPGRLGPGSQTWRPDANATETSRLHTPGLDSDGTPLIAFGVIGALVFGLMAFSTSVRVGKTSASVQIGSTS